MGHRLFVHEQRLPSSWVSGAAGRESSLSGRQPGTGACSNGTSCYSLQVGYTYLEDPAVQLYKDHPDVQAFEVRWLPVCSGSCNLTTRL